LNGITRSKYLVAVLAVLVCGALSATAIALPAAAAQHKAVAAATP
jgi:uncharacterized membrane protein